MLSREPIWGRGLPTPGGEVVDDTAADPFDHEGKNLLTIYKMVNSTQNYVAIVIIGYSCACWRISCAGAILKVW